MYKIEVAVIIGIIIFGAGIAFGQGWAKTYGGSGNEQAYSIILTNDGGYIAAGLTVTFGSGSSDAWIVKISDVGNIQWQKAYGGNSADFASAIREVPGNGYIFVGTTYSFGAGNADIWVVKIDSNGEVQWQKAFGGTAEDGGYDVQLAQGGGYFLTGYSYSYASGNSDIVLIKLDANGSLLMEKKYGGNGSEFPGSMIQTASQDIVIAGYSSSCGFGGFDAFVMKLTSDGSIIWQKCYGNYLNEKAQSFEISSSGQIMLAGMTESYATYGADFWLLSLTSTGDVTWQKRYNAGYSDALYSVRQTNDSNYVAMGRTDLTGAEEWDFVIFKFDVNGAILWSKSYGDISNEFGYDMRSTSDNGFIVGAYTASFGAGNNDMFILKLNSTGNLDASCKFVSTIMLTSTDSGFQTATSPFLPQDITVTVTTPTAPATTSTGTSDFSCPSGFIDLKPYLGKKPAVDDFNSQTPNGIIEPGETVDLLGHLQNEGTMNANNTEGFLSTSDPIDIIQPGAFYGTVAYGGHKQCLSCYTVRAPAGNRPSVHWDFHVTEEVTADSYGPVLFNYIYHVGESFIDVPTYNLFYSFVEKIYHSGITDGCTTTTYCPADPVARQQMAKFICRSMNTITSNSCPAAGCTNIFSDVTASNPFCAYIEALYLKQVASGCATSPLRYCPAASTQRQSMAKFVCLGLEGAESGLCPTSACTAYLLMSLQAILSVHILKHFTISRLFLDVPLVFIVLSIS